MVFGDLFSVTIDDPVHSANEQRFVDIGASEEGRVLGVESYTERGRQIRIISCRKASEKNGDSMKNLPTKTTQRSDSSVPDEYDFAGGKRVANIIELCKPVYIMAVHQAEGTVIVKEVQPKRVRWS